jgi:3-(3-hydroxy-phenyl)propionate hydroxylase
MCSGIRDAAALAWRLILALAGARERTLFDSYQIEREPHVRLITQAAIETGRVVCTLDSQVAAARDARMFASKAAGEPMPDIRSPALAVAFGLPETTRAGEQFIQPVIVGDGGLPQRMDDVLGPGAWLIVQHTAIAADRSVLGLRVFHLDSPALSPFRSALQSWLATANAEAVLVRADRYVFGTGSALQLLAAYSEQAGIRTERQAEFPLPLF